MLTITVTLEFTSPPAIGAGEQRGFIKAPDGWPYIPASAFKGQLRHAVERAAQGLTRAVCATHRKMCREAERACPACRIFGSPWIPGALRFADLTLSGPPELLARRETLRRKGLPLQSPYRYGVGINRRRGVAGEHLLYTTELFEPGLPAAFSGMLSGDLRLEEAAWVVAGLHLLQGLGKSKSAGLGWCHAAARVEQDDAPVEMAQLRAALLQEVA